MVTSQLYLSAYITTYLIGFPSNALALYTFCRKVHRKPIPIDILLLNLTLSDLMFLAFLPFKMKETVDNMVWLLPDFLCPLSSFMFYSTIYTSTLFLTAISVERYLGVTFPFRYSVGRRSRYSVIASVFLWLFSFLNLSFVYIVPTLPLGSDYADRNNSVVSSRMCYNGFHSEQLKILVNVRLELFVVLFCVPFVICSFCYINFIRILSRLPHISRRRRLRAIGLALGTLLVFAVCFGPYNVSHVVGFIREDNEAWRDLALISSTLNASLDPIIFYFSSTAVQSTLSRCLKAVKEKLLVLRCQKAHCCTLTQTSSAVTGKNTSPPQKI
ncbi:free fatty acid receptor 2-like [Chanos chanos]|uniref:Free fatty acid receptor 2-like n=1 Tax=Chanos chanos TaxID=29144 RepID=A0A6J2WJH0_CHACN|nr:free fatty acid receptor 2-like [Chanos chanos]